MHAVEKWQEDEILVGRKSEVMRPWHTAFSSVPPHTYVKLNL
jgi:hypothetical protein